MIKKLEPLVFFGTEDFSAQILTGLIDNNFKIETVITKPDFQKGRGRKTFAPRVKLVAEKHGIPVLAITDRNSMTDAINQTSRQTGVLASFGKIIAPDIIAAFHNGIINVHPSLLPKHRGPSPIETTILNGDRETGTSIMQLVEEVDAGDVYSQSKISLSDHETKSQLYDRLAKESVRLLVTTLQQIREQSIEPKPQDHSQASFTRLFTKKDGLLLPDLYTATELERQVRAFAGFPKSRVSIAGFDLIVLEASVSQKITSPLHLICKDQSVLNINSVIAPSGKTMSAKDFSRGYDLN